MKKPESRLILLSGKMGSGKTMLAEALNYYFGYTKVSLARALKEEVSIALGRPLDKSQDRELLQKTGKMAREKDADYWCKRAAPYLFEGGRFVIDDIRFRNELEYFEREFADLSPFSLRIDFPTEVLRARLSARDGNNQAQFEADSSETDLDNYAGFSGRLSGLRESDKADSIRGAFIILGVGGHITVGENIKEVG